MNNRSIKTINDRILLDDMSVKARVDREIKRRHNLSQMDLDILLCIATCSASHGTQLLSVSDLSFFIGYSESNSGRLYNRVEALSCNEAPRLEKYEGIPNTYSLTYHGTKFIREYLELSKIYKGDLCIFGAS